jgi:hypothetical protein
VTCNNAPRITNYSCRKGWRLPTRRSPGNRRRRQLAGGRAHIAFIRIHGVSPGLAGAMIAKDFPFAKDLPLTRCFSFVIM